MGMSVGSVVNVQYTGRLFQQTVINGFTYVVGVADPTTTVLDELQGIVDYFQSAGVGDPRLAYLGCLPENVFVNRVSAQQIYPIRSRIVAAFVDYQGTRDPAVTANQASVVTYQTNFGGRDQISSNHFPLSAADCSSANISAALKSNLDLFAEIRRTFFTIPTTQTSMNPCIYHRSPNANPKTHEITSHVVQDTARVMRRRTVGVGI